MFPFFCSPLFSVLLLMQAYCEKRLQLCVAFFIAYSGNMMPDSGKILIDSTLQ